MDELGEKDLLGKPVRWGQIRQHPHKKFRNFGLRLTPGKQEIELRDIVDVETRNYFFVIKRYIQNINT